VHACKNITTDKILHDWLNNAYVQITLSPFFRSFHLSIEMSLSTVVSDFNPENADNLKSTQQLLNKSTSVAQFGTSLRQYSKQTGSLIAKVTATEGSPWLHWNRQTQYRITEDIFHLAVCEAELLQEDSTHCISSALWSTFSSGRGPTQSPVVSFLRQYFFNEKFSKDHTDNPRMEIELGLNLVAAYPFLAVSPGQQHTK